MNTLFLFAVAQVWGLLLITLMPISFVGVLAYRNWKSKHDLREALLAKERLDSPETDSFDVMCDPASDAKTLLRYCRTYNVELSTFGFTHDGLVESILKAPNVPIDARSKLAQYYMRHV